jgi:hypothetical protein
VWIEPGGAAKFVKRLVDSITHLTPKSQELVDSCALQRFWVLARPRAQAIAVSLGVRGAIRIRKIYQDC